MLSKVERVGKVTGIMKQRVEYVEPFARAQETPELINKIDMACCQLVNYNVVFTTLFRLNPWGVSILAEPGILTSVPCRVG